MKKIGIFGGSFDPPHLGHVQAAKAAVEQLGLDNLLVIPAATAPNKAAGHCADGAQRLEMLRLAFQGVSGVEISPVELERGGVSYTCDTLDQLCRQQADVQWYLLLGSDSFATLPQWKNVEQILARATVAVFGRGKKAEQEAVAQGVSQLEDRGYPVCRVENVATPISSTQLRRMLVFGCADEFLPSGVGAYIRANGLYGTGRDYKNLPEKELEQVAISLLKPNRVAHVLGCRDTAVELAKRWGADPTDAARAALLHDVTKALDGGLQLTLCRAYGKMLDDFSLRYPKTLHALTGSLVAGRIFGENEAVVSAIESHTTGKAAMNMLETIIYVADYMEPNRDFPGVEQLRHLTTVDMEQALKCGLEMTLDHLKEQGAEVSPASRAALEYLNNKK